MSSQSHPIGASAFISVIPAKENAAADKPTSMVASVEGANTEGHCPWTTEDERRAEEKLRARGVMFEFEDEGEERQDREMR